VHNNASHCEIVRTRLDQQTNNELFKPFQRLLFVEYRYVTITKLSLHKKIDGQAVIRTDRDNVIRDHFISQLCRPINQIMFFCNSLQ
jgi:hypothetical protein